MKSKIDVLIMLYYLFKYQYPDSTWKLGISKIWNPTTNLNRKDILIGIIYHYHIYKDNEMYFYKKLEL